MVVERARGSAREERVVRGLGGVVRRRGVGRGLAAGAGLCLASAGCASIAPEVSAPIAMTVRVPQITLDRLDAQLHLRIFERTGDLRCDVASGRVTGDNAYGRIAGRSISPNERCDVARWNQLREANGEASPTDTCFDKGGGPQTVRVPGGKSYIVLVEGSGQTAAAGGGTQRITLGSGCSEVSTMPGQTISVSIAMQEQADIGRCGDMRVSSGEVCDEGAPSPTCNARCRIPEFDPSPNEMGPVTRPALAWAMGQNLLVTFAGAGTNDDPQLRMLSPTGAVITSPAVLARDNPLDSVARSEQTAVRVAAAPGGFAAAWQTLEAGSVFDVNGFVANNYEAPVPMQMVLNPMTAGRGTNGRLAPAVAIAGSTVAFLFEDADARTISVSRTTLAAAPAAPASETALLSAGMPGAAEPTAPALVGLTDGTFVAAWVSGAAGGRDVYVAKLSAAGALMGAPVLASTQTGNDQDQVALGTNGSDVVVAWRDASGADPMDNLGTTVRWRHFSSALAPSGPDRLAPVTVAGDQSEPTVAVTPAGTVLLAWTDAGTGSIRGRLFKTDGAQVVNRFSASTGDFEVNASADEGGPAGGMRRSPSAAFGGQSRFAVGWLDGTSRRIRVRVFIE
jgi:hypothetical protein